MRKPTPCEIEAARNGTVPDVIAPDLRVLFVGINPSLYSAAVGHHFARPGNRFWPALFASGFTDRLLSPIEDSELLSRRLGLTNLACRATATADELSEEELVEGATRLRRVARRHQPAVVAYLGITAYRIAFGEKRACLGRQPKELEGSQAWILPNPSGLNAHYQLADLARLFGELRSYVETVRG